jgi:glucose dehydrogenase
MTYALGRNVFGSIVASAMAALLYGCATHATQAAAEPTAAAMQPDASANDAPTFDTLLDATHQTDDWILPGHGYDDNRYVKSTIARGRLSGLSLAWSTRLADDGEQEAAPIVWQGTIFLSTPHNHVVALNGKTGALVWDSPYTPAAILNLRRIVESALQPAKCLSRRKTAGSAHSMRVRGSKYGVLRGARMR